MKLLSDRIPPASTRTAVTVWISATHFSPPSSDKKNSGSALRAMGRHVLAAPPTSSSAGRQINRLTIGPDLATILSMLPMAILLGRKTRRSQKRATGSSVTGPLPGAEGDSESTSSAPAPLSSSSPLEKSSATLAESLPCVASIAANTKTRSKICSA